MTLCITAVLSLGSFCILSHFVPFCVDLYLQYNLAHSNTVYLFIIIILLLVKDLNTSTTTPLEYKCCINPKPTGNFPKKHHRV